MACFNMVAGALSWCLPLVRWSSAPRRKTPSCSTQSLGRTADSSRWLPSQHGQSADTMAVLYRSHGTLGFLVGAELSIVPAKKYLKLTYEPYTTQASGVDVRKASWLLTSLISCDAREHGDNAVTICHELLTARLACVHFKRTMTLSNRWSTPRTRWC
jgi:hypothetical protein